MTRPLISQFLLTRFNIPMHQRPGGNLDPDWLEHRLDMFHAYCLPSIKAQSWQDFRWLIAVDERTPVPYLKTLLSMPLPPQANVVLVHEGENFKNRLKSVISSTLPKATEATLITTRIDNDDAISPDYLKSIRLAALNLFRPLPFFVDAPKGWTYETMHGHFRPRGYENHGTALSPFLTVVEKFNTGKLMTAFCGDHGQLREKYPRMKIIQLADPQWVQVLHGRNVANSIGAANPIGPAAAAALKASLGWRKNV